VNQTADHEGHASTPAHAAVGMDQTGHKYKSTDIDEAGTDNGWTFTLWREDPPPDSKASAARSEAGREADSARAA
jgi:hypothetical protein